VPGPGVLNLKSYEGLCKPVVPRFGVKVECQLETTYSPFWTSPALVSYEPGPGIFSSTWINLRPVFILAAFEFLIYM